MGLTLGLFCYAPSRSGKTAECLSTHSGCSHCHAAWGQGPLWTWPLTPEQTVCRVSLFSTQENCNRLRLDAISVWKTEVRVVLNIRRCTGRPPPQRITWPQMSVASMSFCSLAPFLPFCDYCCPRSRWLQFSCGCQFSMSPVFDCSFLFFFF